MKRLIALVLLIVILLPDAAVASSQSDGEHLTRARAVEEIVKALYLSGGETKFTFEDYYCMHPGGGGYVHFVPDEYMLKDGYPVLCEIYASVNGREFADISVKKGDMSTYIILASAMGFINGYEDNTFRPDRAVTYNEAVKMFVCAFGFGELGKSNGGYPDGYIKSAAVLGITEGIKFNGGDTVSRQDFNNMLTASLGLMHSNALKLFVPPATPYECAELYAEAVMQRDGVMQFALFDDELKNSTRVTFERVTGVSSPWVTGFDIEQTGDLEFKIVFHYATSTGLSGDGVVKLLLSQTAGGYKISRVVTS